MLSGCLKNLLSTLVVDWSSLPGNPTRIDGGDLLIHRLMIAYESA